MFVNFTLQYCTKHFIIMEGERNHGLSQSTVVKTKRNDYLKVQRQEIFELMSSLRPYGFLIIVSFENFCVIPRCPGQR